MSTDAPHASPSTPAGGGQTPGGTAKTSIFDPASSARSWPAWLAEQQPRLDAVGTLARALAGTSAAGAPTPGALLDALASNDLLDLLPSVAMAAREWTAGDGGAVAVGHLYRAAGGWRLVVECPSCPRWHWHGAGSGDLAPGAITPRVSHCADRHAYTAIRVAGPTFDPRWATARGNRSAAYRRFLAIGHTTKH